MLLRRLMLTGIAVAGVSAAGLGTAAAAPVTAGTGADVTVTVCASGCTYTTIAAALAAAVSGETIDVKAGTYAGGFVVRTPVKIEGAGRASTIISGGAANKGTVVQVKADPVTIHGVTITGGSWTPASGLVGGGVLVSSGGLLNVTNCYINNNEGNDGPGGGGLNIEGTTKLRYCEVANDSAGGGAGQGGGIHVGSSGVVNMMGGSVHHDDAASGGGIIIDSGGSVTLAGTWVTGNISSTEGGGIENNGTLTATNTNINRNNTQGRGGGMIQNGSATLTDSFVLRNTTTAPVGNGGGIYVTSGHTVTLNNTEVLHNHPDNLVQG